MRALKRFQPSNHFCRAAPFAAWLIAGLLFSACQKPDAAASHFEAAVLAAFETRSVDDLLALYHLEDTSREYQKALRITLYSDIDKGVPAQVTVLPLDPSAAQTAPPGWQFNLAPEAKLTVVWQGLPRLESEFLIGHIDGHYRFVGAVRDAPEG